MAYNELATWYFFLRTLSLKPVTIPSLSNCLNKVECVKVLVCNPVIDDEGTTISVCSLIIWLFPFDVSWIIGLTLTLMPSFFYQENAW